MFFFFAKKSKKHLWELLRKNAPVLLRAHNNLKKEIFMRCFQRSLKRYRMCVKSKRIIMNPSSHLERITPKKRKNESFRIFDKKSKPMYWFGKTRRFLINIVRIVYRFDEIYWFLSEIWNEFALFDMEGLEIIPICFFVFVFYRFFFNWQNLI